MLLERLNVVLGWDGSAVEKGVRRTDRSFGKLEGSAMSLGRAMRLAAGGTAAAAAFALAADKVFDLGAAVEETASKFRTTLGPETQRVSGFLDEFAQKAGLSSRVGQDLTSTMAAVAQGMGATKKQSADLAIGTASLAGDLASFHNTAGGSAEVLRDMRSALVGEFEPMKKYGIVLNAASVQQKALAMTGKESASELTQLEKATASMVLMQERAGVAVGDLDRTFSSGANVRRRVGAQFRDIGNALAQAANPALTVFLEEIADGADDMEEFSRNLTHISVTLEILAAEIVAVGRTVVNSIQIMFGVLAKTAVDALVPVARVLESLASVIPGWDSVLDSEHLIRVSDEISMSMERDLAQIGDAWKGLGDTILDGTRRLEGFGATGSSAMNQVADSAERAAEAVERATEAMAVSRGAHNRTWLEGRTRPGLDLVPDNLPATLPRMTGTRSKGGGIFGGLGDEIKSGLGSSLDRLKGLLDPSMIVSNLASGGISSLLSFGTGVLGEALGGLFGGDDTAQRIADELDANSRALERNTAEMARTLFATSGSSVSGIEGAISRALQASRGAGFGETGRLLAFGQAFTMELEKLGLSMEDVNAIAEGMGITLNGTIESFEQFREALQTTAQEALKTFSGGFGLLQQEFGLLDIEDPGEQFARIIDLLADSVSSGFGDQIRGLTAENIDRFIADFLADLRAGKDVFSLLGDLTLDEFLRGIGAAESALDRMATETERTTSALKNVPPVFKLNLARFRADRGGVPSGGLPRSDPGAPGLPPGGLDRTIVTGQRTGSPAPGIGPGVLGSVYVAGDIVLPGVTRPGEFLSELERSAQWKAKTGAHVIPVRTRRGG